MISCADRASSLLLCAVLVAVLAVPASAKKGRQVSEDDLINVLLSPSLAKWLVGPIARIASADEIRAYLRLSDDQAATRFIESFWQGRTDPENPWPGKQLRDVFDERAEEADRLFTEGIRVGRRTDRGVTYVLFGPPEKRGYVQEAGPRKTTVEIWAYPPKAEPGLDGSRPSTAYYFTQKDGVTVFTQRPRKLETLPGPRVP